MCDPRVRYRSARVTLASGILDLSPPRVSKPWETNDRDKGQGPVASAAANTPHHHFPNQALEDDLAHTLGRRSTMERSGGQCGRFPGRIKMQHLEAGLWLETYFLAEVRALRHPGPGRRCGGASTITRCYYREKTMLSWDPAICHAHEQREYFALAPANILSGQSQIHDRDK